MLAKVQSYGLQGLNGYPVTVETDIVQGLPNYETVGLPDAAVKESRERVHAAIRHSGCAYPLAHITVNLAPADLKKEGSVYDLPIVEAVTEGNYKNTMYDNDSVDFQDIEDGNTFNGK
mgnify:CR=1 FL=1